MIYAPVIIPTLNRYDHFQKCLESLEQCVDADKTTVYIGLDYPPSEKYVDGWKRIDSYLKEKEEHHLFRELIVIRREVNCGILGEKSNGRLLHNQLKKEGYDRCIFSEDDNLFAPNFLVYMNKGLDIFYGDDDVLCICGYTHPYSLKFKDNTFFFHNVYCSAWGVGEWIHKVDEYRRWTDPKKFRDSFSLSNLMKIFKVGRRKVLIYLNLCKNYEPVPMTDYNMGVYAALNDKNVVCPKISLVRNIGCDGTGLSFHEVDREYTERMNSQPISCDTNFDFVGTGFEYYKDNRKVLRDGFIGNPSRKRVVKELVKFLLWYLKNR